MGAQRMAGGSTPARRKRACRAQLAYSHVKQPVQPASARHVGIMDTGVFHRPRGVSLALGRRLLFFSLTKVKERSAGRRYVLVWPLVRGAACRVSGTHAS